jgi:epoxyqueuosine reductase
MESQSIADALFERAVASMSEVSLFGVARVEDMEGTPLYDSAVALMPKAKSIMVLGKEIFAEVVNLIHPDQIMGEAAARDLYAPHLDYLNGRLNCAMYDLANTYRDEGYRVIPLPSMGTPTDTRFLRGLVSFKHAAEFAGLGAIGRSSLLITPQFGPRVRLAALLMDAEVPSGKKMATDFCAGCNAPCVAACPAGAIAMPDGGQPYRVDKFACASFRGGAGGCATCLSVCPVGRR